MHYGRQLNNIPILSVFPIVTFMDMCWLYFFGCASTWNIFGAGVVGMVMGFIWSEAIYHTHLRKIQYFSILNHDDLCNITSQYTQKSYKCLPQPVASPHNVEQVKNNTVTTNISPNRVTTSQNQPNNEEVKKSAQVKPVNDLGTYQIPELVKNSQSYYGADGKILQ
jgi:hypothetical protein